MTEALAGERRRLVEAYVRAFAGVASVPLTGDEVDALTVAVDSLLAHADRLRDTGDLPMPNGAEAEGHAGQGR